MTISINEATKEITVEQSDLSLVSGTLYTHNTEQFRNTMNDLMDDERYIWMDDYAARNAPVNVGGVTLAQTIELINGFNITYDDTPGAFSVRLEGSNNNLFDIENGILNQNLAQVIPTNSAGLTFSREIQDLSYNGGRIFIDTVNGVTGVNYPNGTTVNPVNNFANAESIIQNRSLPKSVLLDGSLTFTTEDISEYDFVGTAATHDTIDVGTGTTDGTVFDCLKIQGTINGTVHCKDCILAGLNDFEGFLVGGAVGGTLTLAGEAHIVNAHAAASGTDYITIDYQGNALPAFIPGWEGAMHIINHSNAGALTAIDMKSGEITLESTCTDGTIVIRGTGTVVDNSGAGCTVVTDSLNDSLKIIESWQLLGLDPDNPVTRTPASVSVDGISQSVVGDHEVSIVVERN